MNWWFAGMVLLMIPLSAAGALGATLSGTAYTYDLQVARYSLLSIDTAPPQRLLLHDGTYEISVPQGTYTMRVVYTLDSRQYEDELTVTVTDEGTYNYDFILFPSERNATQPLPQIDDIIIPQTREQLHIGWMPAALLILVLVALATFFGRRRWWSKEPARTTETAPPEAADLESIITVLKKEGGRTTQKELRRHIPCSEAKMSMMLTELEHKGRIERIRKGRANLIVLK